MYGMNRILSEIGWAAVAVDGFIPPAAFMEFQAHNVLVIAADIRPIDQVLYTPAPDIIHEAAGHAPIIADEEYSAYLREFGRVGTLAFSSAFDNKIYKAIRHLSILKADPYTPFDLIEQAESDLDILSKLQETPSEMALLRNLHWWTVEYGLIGTVDNPKIYGAGLLSSIGESHNCLKPNVKKIAYSLDAQNYAFDITNQQPQLFVTPDFNQLQTVLSQYLDTMAVSKGGMGGLKKALQASTTSTLVYNTGLQVSGKPAKVYHHDNMPVYLAFEGPVMLCFGNQLLEGHGITYHKDGFGSPVGKIKGISGLIETMSEGELAENRIIIGDILNLEFNSGVKVTGRLEKITSQLGRNLLFSFQDCTVTYKGNVFFRPEWGVFDMAVGESIISCFSGPANPDAFGLRYPAPLEKTHHIIHTDKTVRLFSLYSRVRAEREKGSDPSVLEDTWQILKLEYPEEWLLPLEIAEELVTKYNNTDSADEIIAHIIGMAGNKEDILTLIRDGLSLIRHQP
jgi:phenylalanine-4-hydroxylase